jgi:glycosyltransferase involved in cell wall biosynthesis
MIHQPTISIIIPTWNREQHLNKALSSIYTQHVPVTGEGPEFKIEVIIIDDGSTDQTFKNVVEPFMQKCHSTLDVWKKFKVIYHLMDSEGAPHGASACRNKGLDLMTGSYLCFLDSDDVFIDSTVLKAFVDAAKQGSGFFFYGATRMYEHDTVSLYTHTHTFDYYPDTESAFFTSGGAIPIGSFMVAAGVVQMMENKYFDVHMKVGEDYEWQMRLRQEGPFTRINKEVLRYFRSQTGSLTTGSLLPEVRDYTAKKLDLVRSSRSFPPHTKIDIPFKVGFCSVDNPLLNTILVQIAHYKGSLFLPTDHPLHQEHLLSGGPTFGIDIYDGKWYHLFPEDLAIWIVAPLPMSSTMEKIVSTYRILFVYNNALAADIRASYPEATVVYLPIPVVSTHLDPSPQFDPLAPIVILDAPVWFKTATRKKAFPRPWVPLSREEFMGHSDSVYAVLDPTRLYYDNLLHRKVNQLTGRYMTTGLAGKGLSPRSQFSLFCPATQMLDILESIFESGDLMVSFNSQLTSYHDSSLLITEWIEKVWLALIDNCSYTIATRSSNV